MKIFGRLWYKEYGFKHLLYIITSPIRTFVASFKKTIEWFPIIWKDRDWDHTYFYIVLKHKLEMMSKYEKKYAIAERSAEIAEKMDEAVNLIDKLLNYDYTEEAEKPFYEVYPDFKLDIKFVPPTDGSKFGEIKFNLDDDPKMRELYNRYIWDGDKVESADKDKLFDLIKENIYDWWD